MQNRSGCVVPLFRSDSLELGCLRNAAIDLPRSTGSVGTTLRKNRAAIQGDLTRKILGKSWKMETMMVGL